MRILELGQYIAPAYAGMILAEQGHTVDKWTFNDPIHELNRGAELWTWINYNKTLSDRHASDITRIEANEYDIVIDNIRQDTWTKWNIDPATEAQRLNVTWVSLRADNNKRSFDIIAQARAWGNYGTLPFYLGDTAAGLWLAFKALSAPKGHHVIYQATVLAKLVEGELVAPKDTNNPWDEPNTFGVYNNEALVVYKNETITEPMRDNAWRKANLPNVEGRFTV